MRVELRVRVTVRVRVRVRVRFRVRVRIGVGVGVGVAVGVACQAASGERRGGSADAAASVSGLKRRSSLASRGSTPAAAASQSAVRGCDP